MVDFLHHVAAKSVIRLKISIRSHRVRPILLARLFWNVLRLDTFMSSEESYVRRLSELMIWPIEKYVVHSEAASQPGLVVEYKLTINTRSRR